MTTAEELESVVRNVFAQKGVDLPFVERHPGHGSQKVHNPHKQGRSGSGDDGGGKFLQDQIYKKLGGSIPVGPEHALVLEAPNGRQMPVFVQVKKKSKGGVIHINTLTRVNTPSGKSWGLQKFRIDSKSRLKDDGFDTITEKQKNDWISRHQKGMAERS